MAVRVMTTNPPWWYSGASSQDQAPDDAGDSAQDRSSRPRFDIAGLASGAQQLVDLARQTLLAPHAGHVDPTEHPECMVCRTMAAVGEVRVASDRAEPAPRVEWIALEPPRR